MKKKKKKLKKSISKNQRKTKKRVIKISKKSNKFKIKNKSVKKKKVEIVLTADTAVALGRRILQKPNNEEEALYFLNLLLLNLPIL